MSNIGDFIKAKREEKGLSLRDLEKLSGVSKSYIVQIENDQRGTPQPDKIALLAKGLNEDYMELMRVAGYVEIPPEYQAQGLKHVSLADEYINKGLTEEEIRKVLDGVLAYVESKKKSEFVD